MKNIFLLLLLCACSYSISAQTPAEAFDLTNGMYELWKTSPRDKAVEASVRLNKIYPPFFIDKIHNVLSQTIQRDPNNKDMQDYLEILWNKKDPDINAIIEPFYVWNKSNFVTDKSEAEKLLTKYLTLLKDSSNIKAKTELYGLLILKNLTIKNLVPVDMQAILLDKIISNMQKYPFLDTPDPSGQNVGPRAWHRYMMAFSEFVKYQTDGKNAECLKLAAKYSPDLTDMRRKDFFFYDAYLLTGNSKQIGFQSMYISYLEKNQLFAEELELLLETCYGEPTNENIQKLKDFKTNHPGEEDFKACWSKYVNSKMKQAPALKVAYVNDTLDFTQNRSHWTLIDTWGTWCSPCCKELPHFNEVANKYNNLKVSNIRIRTFSYFSIDLPDFMEKNKYTFPVAEIREDVTKPFGINSYPTKLLISPDNKYLIIPFNTDWEQYMRNYCLIE